MPVVPIAFWDELPQEDGLERDETVTDADVELLDFGGGTGGTEAKEVDEGGCIEVADIWEVTSVGPLEGCEKKIRKLKLVGGFLEAHQNCGYSEVIFSRTGCKMI